VSDKQLKIMWQSNAPFVGTGYGSQTALFCGLATDEGHEVITVAFYGLNGAPLTLKPNWRVLPGSFHAFGDDIMVAHKEVHDPDVFVALQDSWVLERDTIVNSEAILWAPIDHDPIPPAVAERLPHAKGVWAMSKHGLKLLHQAGIYADYVPHGVDVEVFKPLERKAEREKLKVDADTFVVAMVAANKGYPNRKSLVEVIKAWSYFVKKYPDSLLFLHTEPKTRPGMQNIDLEKVAKFYGLTEKTLRFPDEYRHMMGQFSPALLNQLYNVADVFLLPSRGEGFGIPAVEAQAAGCPVILTAWTAQTELCGAGWLIEPDELDDLEITLQYSEQARIRPSMILAALEKAREARGDQALRDKAREFALEYDHRVVWEKFMYPAMLRAARDKAAQDAREKARKDLRPKAEPLPELPAEEQDTVKHEPVPEVGSTEPVALPEVEGAL
jgi:glycosyltransferase involved in cell wall biosynthesis